MKRTQQRMVKTYQTEVEQQQDEERMRQEGWAVDDTVLMPPLRATKAYLGSRWFRAWTRVGSPPEFEIVVTYVRQAA